MDKYKVAEIVAENDIEGKDYIKISASKQRELFGFAAFGQKSIKFNSDGQGTVSISVSKCFGTDSYTKTISYEQFADYCNRREKIEI